MAPAAALKEGGKSAPGGRPRRSCAPTSLDDESIARRTAERMEGGKNGPSVPKKRKVVEEPKAAEGVVAKAPVKRARGGAAKGAPFVVAADCGLAVISGEGGEVWLLYVDRSDPYVAFCDGSNLVESWNLPLGVGEVEQVHRVPVFNLPQQGARGEVEGWYFKPSADTAGVCENHPTAFVDEFTVCEDGSVFVSVGEWEDAKAKMK